MLSSVDCTGICGLSDNSQPGNDPLCAELKQKGRKKRAYALTGFSWAIFHIKKNPKASITVRTLSA